MTSTFNISTIPGYYTSISLDLIEQNLYLGNITAAKDINTLTKCNIKHVITIDVSPMPRHVQHKLGIATMYIPLLDLPNEDLLSHFDDIYKFINEGVTKGGVLVHCYLGISRSATAVIAFLMKKYNYTYNVAFNCVKEKRPIINPNMGFVAQLQLYYDMKCSINKNYIPYKMFRLKSAAYKFKYTRNFPLEFLEVIKPDPENVDCKNMHMDELRCKMCKRILARECNLLPHMDLHMMNNVCTESLSIEPLAWMEHITKQQEGKLRCPRCYNKVGIFSWITNYQCMCGFDISPIFLIFNSSSYFSNSRQNS